jgi:excisionase family DNA binding protein
MGEMESPAEEGEGREQATVEPRFFTLKDVARYLSVSEPQAYALVRSGELPAIKIGGRGVWRVDRHQLEKYVERLHRETYEWTQSHPLGSGEKSRN